MSDHSFGRAKGPGMARELMVKQYVGRIKSKTGTTFQVFESGDPAYYVFDPLDERGCSGCAQFPVKKTDLKDDVRKYLRG